MGGDEGHDAALPGRGHRILPHTADEIVDAWGPTREACLEEAVRGLAATFAEIPSDAATIRHEFTVPLAADDLLLVDVLEEVVFLLDARDQVPVHVSVSAAGDEVRVVLHVADLDDVTAVGAAPKGVAHCDLSLQTEAGAWVARATIDI